MKPTALLAGIRAAVAGDRTLEPGQYMAADKLIRCGHCLETSFFATRASFHTAGDSLFDLEWLAKEVHVLVCATCTHLEQFYDAPERVRVVG